MTRISLPALALLAALGPLPALAEGTPRQIEAEGWFALASLALVAALALVQWSVSRVRRRVAALEGRAR
jgi:hypothetical protein